MRSWQSIICFLVLKNNNTYTRLVKRYIGILVALEWFNLVDRDLYCKRDEKVIECISRAYDYGLLHIPLVESNELLGLIDFYKLAGVISIYKNNFSKISCKDIRNTISRTKVSVKESLNTVIRRMTMGNYTSMGVSSKPKVFEGTITAKSIALQLLHKFENMRVGEVASSRVGIVGSGADLYQILSIISRRRQPCVIVFDGYDVEGIVCLDDVMYMLSQFEGTLPLYESTTRDVIRSPKIIDAESKLGEKGPQILDAPLLVSENGEIAGLLSIEDILVYARRKFTTQHSLQ